MEMVAMIMCEAIHKYDHCIFRVIGLLASEIGLGIADSKALKHNMRVS
jgi:hypothetical protein